MKRIFCLAGLIAFVGLAPGSARAGNFSDMQAFSYCSGANEYYSVGGGKCVECDDDYGDAPAKTRGYYYNSSDGKVYSRRCYIDSDLFGDDRWTSREVVSKCVSNRCSGNTTVIPYSDYAVCSNRAMKTIGDSVFVNGGGSDNVDCYINTKQSGAGDSSGSNSSGGSSSGGGKSVAGNFIDNLISSAGSGNTNSDIANACYATRKCGARSFLNSQAFAAMSGVAGATTGAALGTLFGPVGTIVGVTGGGYAGYVTGQNLGGKIGYGANEYIYFEDGTCIECDTYQMGEHYECPNGTIASNGSDFFRCRTTTSGDSWNKINPLPICSNSPIRDKNVKNSKMEIKATVNKRVSSGVSVFSGDACFYITCGNGVLDSAKNECVEKVKPVEPSACPEGSSDAFITHEACLDKGTFECTKKSDDGITCLCGKCNPSDGNGGGNGGGVVPPAESSLEKCLKSRNTSAGKACCYLPNAVATWDGTNCNCVGEGMEFEIGPDGRGVCNVKQPEPGVAFSCDVTIVNIINNWNVSCATNVQIVTLINQINTLCASGTGTAESFNSLYQTLLALNPGNCAESRVEDRIEEEQNKVAQNSAKISEAKGKLDSIIGGLDVSKWKNAEGKFNTARLASDSIAGVVLGTAGGLITSSVVKKHQVKEGFEDLNCVIGGQAVANWGDEFNVGVK